MELKVGMKIKIGVKYASDHNFKPNEVIELIEGQFEHDNGLYTEIQHAPSIPSKYDDEFDSIYHLFGNDLENFMDCEIVTPKPEEK